MSFVSGYDGCGAFINYNVVARSASIIQGGVMDRQIRCVADLRELFTDGIHESDTVLLLATKGVLTRPWCMLEILEARKKGVPVLVRRNVGVD